MPHSLTDLVSSSKIVSVTYNVLILSLFLISRCSLVKRILSVEQINVVRYNCGCWDTKAIVLGCDHLVKCAAQALG